MGKNLHRVVKNNLINIWYFFRGICVLPIFSVTAFANANEPYPIEWRSVVIEAYDDRLGRIKLEANETRDRRLRLSVDSEVMKGKLPLALTEDIDNPNIQSLSIQVTDSYDAEVSGFSICFWYGEAARINMGSEESPKYRWQQRQVTYTISKAGASRKIYSNTGILKVSSCKPN